MAAKIIALHGFLGQRVDFKNLNLCNLHAVDIWATPLHSLASWARRFNYYVDDGSILLGYSMGGRLALHCLLDQPKLYQAAIIISAHPGLCSQKLKNARLMHDHRLAQDFLYKPWHELMKQWNTQAVFQGDHDINRDEQLYQRAILASALKHFSLGAQEQLHASIAKLPKPILWINSHLEAERIKDIKFAHPHSRKVIFNEGGHRLLFSHAGAVSHQIRKFIHDIARSTLELTAT